MKHAKIERSGGYTRWKGRVGRLKPMNIADKKYDLVLILTSNLLKYNFQKVKNI